MFLKTKQRKNCFSLLISLVLQTKNDVMYKTVTVNYEPETTPEEIKDLMQRSNEEEMDASPSVIPPPDIVAFNEQRSCADIYRMYQKGQIEISPDFQRGEVWRNSAQTLFLDEKKDWKLSKSDDVDLRISGKKVSEIKIENPNLVAILENVTIPITVIRCDYSNQEHMKYLFQIFYRLNSGGNKLYNQEIRNCIFQGPFNSLLKELARTPEWYNFAKTDQQKVDKARFNNEERILRFFAFYYSYDNYRGKLSAFLNSYMDRNKNSDDDRIEQFKSLFISTLKIANQLNTRFDSKNIAEAVMIGIAFNIESLQNIDVNTLNTMCANLHNEPLFAPEEMKEGLSSEEKVKGRIESAINVFSHG